MIWALLVYLSYFSHWNWQMDSGMRSIVTRLEKCSTNRHIRIFFILFRNIFVLTITMTSRGRRGSQITKKIDCLFNNLPNLTPKNQRSPSLALCEGNPKMTSKAESLTIASRLHALHITGSSGLSSSDVCLCKYPGSAYVPLHTFPYIVVLRNPFHKRDMGTYSKFCKCICSS